jgi:general secretion pathway protein D
VLAGLINNEEPSTGRKIPALGDIPLLGSLFGSTVDDEQKTEIVLSLMPRLVRNIERPEASEPEFAACTEGSFRRRPQAAANAPARLPVPPEAPLPPAPPQPDAGPVPIQAGLAEPAPEPGQGEAK